MQNTFTTDKATRSSLALLPGVTSTAVDLLDAFSLSLNVCRLVHILTTHHLTSCHITSCHCTSHHVMSHDVMSHDVMSHDVTQHSRQCPLTQSWCLYADDTQTSADRIHTCTLGGNGTGFSRDQSPTAMAAAEDDMPVAYVLKLCPVLCTTCF